MPDRKHKLKKGMREAIAAMNRAIENARLTKEELEEKKAREKAETEELLRRG